MFVNNLIYIGIVIIGIVLILFPLYIHRKSNAKEKKIRAIKSDRLNNVRKLTKTDADVEKIRQMALVQADEFETFYRPIIANVEKYEELLGANKKSKKFYKLVLKGLRKRRAAIFNPESAESNKCDAPFWTYALFCGFAVRYVVRLLNSVEFTDSAGNIITPFLESIDTLSILEKKGLNFHEEYKPNYLYIHFIEQIVPFFGIKLLAEKNVYPFLVNAVTGLYQKRHTPFYTIIETVEQYILEKQEVDLLKQQFLNTLTIILNLISNATLSKNTLESQIFESENALIIDRHLLWELAKTYHVTQDGALSKKVFEKQLVEYLELPDPLLNESIYFIKLLSITAVKEEDLNSMLELRNKIALPYKLIPNYVWTKKIEVIEKKIERMITNYENNSFHKNYHGEEDKSNNYAKSEKNVQEPVKEQLELNQIFK